MVEMVASTAPDKDATTALSTKPKRALILVSANVHADAVYRFIRSLSIVQVLEIQTYKSIFHACDQGKSRSKAVSTCV